MSERNVMTKAIKHNAVICTVPYVHTFMYCTMKEAVTYLIQHKFTQYTMNDMKTIYCMYIHAPLLNRNISFLIHIYHRSDKIKR